MGVAFCQSMMLPKRWMVPVAAQDAAHQRECEDCSEQFWSKQALAVHMYKKHDHRTDVSSRPLSTWCPIRLLQFWTRARILERMGKSKICVANAVLSFAPESSECLVQVNLLERLRIRKARASGRRAHWAQLPCVRLQGPLPPVLTGRMTRGMAGTVGIGRRRHNLI